MVQQDRNLTCAECGTTFVFSADDQRYHQEKGYTDPKRCPSCRANRSSRGPSSFSSGGDRGFGGPRQMHDAVCADCGQKTQVPFLPRGDKPVYCSNCFNKRRSSTGGGGGRGYR
jgi:CxxC-x17-CxxC domain-containing protein